MSIPLTGPRPRVAVTGLNSVWVTQQMAAGQSFDKLLPRSSTVAAEDFDPEVSNGRVEYLELTEGGLFGSISALKVAHIVEKIENPGGATLDIVRSEDISSGDIGNAPTYRSVPSDFPFTLAPGETIRANTGTAGSLISILIKQEAASLR